MYNSERLMRAIGGLSDDKIERTGHALGYQKARRGRTRASAPARRALSAAAAAALILALGVTAYAIYAHWSRGMERRLPATDAEKQWAEQSGLSDVSQGVSAAVNGVTISVEQTIIDRNTAHIALRIEGFALPGGQCPAIGEGWSLTFDGERAANMSGGFVEERDADGKLLFTAPDGSMEFDFTAKAGEKWESFEGKEIRVLIDSLGTGDKGQYQALVEGPWELVWTPSSDSERRILHPNAPIGDSGLTLLDAEIGPLSASVSVKLDTLWEGYKTLEHFDLQLAGVRLRDGSALVNIFGPPAREGYSDEANRILDLSYSSERILRPEQVDALLFARGFPWARTLTEDDLILVPLA